MKIVHVYPTGDWIEHDTTGNPCPCGPRVEYVAGGVVYTHHSLDGREFVEPDYAGPDMPAERPNGSEDGK